ncbi:MAG: (2Fe-2S) ferredoxin domain-containing protein [Clostridia bacterium]|nr:(2Fe-2S) ferredoxin domain-containing protein [Clostridia bacterium]
MIKISVCGGMNCRMFGSEETFEALLKGLERRGLKDQVELTQTFCMGECSRGPCLRVNGVKFRGMDRERAEKLIEDEILPLIL